MIIQVDCASRTLTALGQTIPCEIGKGGVLSAAAKREGDGATPLGRWPIRLALLRPDHNFAPPVTRLPWRWLRAADGWSDDPADPAYNRPVRHPHGFSAERMWRDDRLYDIILVLGHNDDPVVPGAGSAIFLHCREPGRATEGCVTILHEQLAELLSALAPGDLVEIV
jgi:L,D-peptidoglycan transpeptidase YkuD (ErfK/YbiS/YcfS/YnhG family)